MLRTLLLIPHEVAGIPVFGFGWALLILAFALAARLLLIRRGAGESVAAVLGREGMLWAIAAAAIVLVMPRIELHSVTGQPVGVAIRGYGFFLLLGVLSAVGCAAYRAAKAGLNPELIYGLAPWAFIGGIIGARLFYVIQYRDQYIASTWYQTLANMLDFTSGGLVVYGSFIGGFIASAIFVLRNRLSVLRFGDVIVPCLFIGVMFGRLGCLMNGCCYGGRCEPGAMAIQFPPVSKVYQDQLISGELVGLSIDSASNRVTDVRPASLAAEAGIRDGQTVDGLSVDGGYHDQVAPTVPADEVPVGLAASIDGEIHRWAPDELPQRALPVRATQVISSLTGASLAAGLWLLGAWLSRRSWSRHGTLMFVGFSAYAVVRFVLEWVRVDEAGQFGTQLSISQWVSLMVLAVSAIGLLWLYGMGPFGRLAPGKKIRNEAQLKPE